MKVKLLCALVMFTISIIYGEAQIEINQPKQDVGNIRHGDLKEKNKYTFTVKNSGTSALIIEKVKPG